MGAWLAVQLTGLSWTVVALAQDSDVSTSPLLWYRRHQLSSAGVEVMIRNLSNSSQVQALLSLRPSHVVYVPYGLEHGDIPRDSAYWGSCMTGFVAILDTLRSCANVVMISQSPDSHMTIQQAHMTSFEAVLLTYHNLYNTRYTIIRTGPVYGPWTNHSLSLLESQKSGISESGISGSQKSGISESQKSGISGSQKSGISESQKSGISGSQKSGISESGIGVKISSLMSTWYITDVTNAISSALNTEPICDLVDLNHCDHTHSLLNISSPWQPVERRVSKTLHWAKAYHTQLQLINNSQNDVILTSYFTSQEDCQRNKSVSPNRVRYMLDWLVSVRDQGLTAVVFHDQLDSGFCQRVMQYHPGVSFVQVSPPLNRTTNDARFYAYLNYLYTQPDLTRVLLTDISDVRFLRNPFDLMRLLGDWLYIGTDIDIFPNMGSQRWITEHLEGCFGTHALHHGPLRPLMSQDTVYNAGVIGGSRHIMLALLEHVVQYLDTTAPSLNCNMPAVNYVVHRYFHRQVYTGFPLTSRFLSFQSSPKGVYIIHK